MRNEKHAGGQSAEMHHELPAPRPRIALWEDRMGEDGPHLIGTVTPPSDIAALPDALENSLWDLWEEWCEEVDKQETKWTRTRTFLSSWRPRDGRLWKATKWSW